MKSLAKLSVSDLCVSRGGRTLFSGLSFEVISGQALALTGENGAGKTSLLRAIAGLLRPTGGRIDFSGAADANDSSEVVRSQSHLLGHADGFAGALTARAELGFALDWTGGSWDAALPVIEMLNLARALDLPTRQLSAGQRRRLAVVRLIAAPRALWLLDEAAAPLDAAGRVWFGAAMAAHLERGGLIVAAAHDPLPVPATVLRIGR